MSGIWKNVHSAPGETYVAPATTGSFDGVGDCPRCRFGTLEQVDWQRVRCIDCRAVIWCSALPLEYLKAGMK
jgi:hypothetical protein